MEGGIRIGGQAKREFGGLFLEAARIGVWVRKERKERKERKKGSRIFLFSKKVYFFFGKVGLAARIGGDWF